MRTRFTAIIAGIGVAALVIAAVAAIQIGTGDATAQGGPANRGGGAGTEEARVHVEPDVGTALTGAEAADLAYMREEEKLARDVYAALADEYEARVFANITRSEARHAETVLEFMDALGVNDPAAGLPAGAFRDEELQTLYDQLMAQGMQSFEEAVRVGIAIEERDIADLKAAIAATERSDVRAMYENLLAGSENHLRAFTRQIDGSVGAAGGQGGGQGSCY